MRQTLIRYVRSKMPSDLPESAQCAWEKYITQEQFIGREVSKPLTKTDLLPRAAYPIYGEPEYAIRKEAYLTTNYMMDYAEEVGGAFQELRSRGRQIIHRYLLVLRGGDFGRHLRSITRSNDYGRIIGIAQSDHRIRLRESLLVIDAEAVKVVWERLPAPTYNDAGGYGG